MAQSNSKRESMPNQVRLVVEVDGTPVGFLSLDLERLWPLINHQKRDTLPVEWMDPLKFDSLMRAVVMKQLVSRIEARLYKTLGDEMVQAELDAETFTLKADAAAQEFGRSQSEIDKLVAEANRKDGDFHSFFWEYMLDDREVSDLKKEWKTRDIPPR
jgi:hypothetical protein